MKTFTLFAIVTCSLAFVVPNVDELTGEELASFVNKAQSSFLAVHTGKTVKEMKKKLMREEFLVVPKDEDRAPELIIDDLIPASFDARTRWSQCASIQQIRDQSTCGCSWAFGAVEAISDRICVASNGTQQPIISAEDILACCGHTCSKGCEGGGWPIEAWNYWVANGACTGGDYGGPGCKPYPFAPCKKNCEDPDTPFCRTSCQSGYSIPYAQDKLFGLSAYFVAKTVSGIQKEIMTNGPVEATFNTYEDFYQYKSGIYVHTAGNQLGVHSVKILGWGIENGTPYWIVANSWGTDWGENGFFRIIRSVNECGIEADVVAGLPKLTDANRNVHRGNNKE